MFPKFVCRRAGRRAKGSSLPCFARAEWWTPILRINPLRQYVESFFATPRQETLFGFCLIDKPANRLSRPKSVCILCSYFFLLKFPFIHRIYNKLTSLF